MSDRDLADQLREHASQSSVPGAALGILRAKTLTTAYVGVADIATREPVTAHTRFALGSLGKPMAATMAVMVAAQLAADGRFSLDDPLARHVPELHGVAWAERAIVMDLLAGRSRVPLSVASDFTEWPDDDDGVLSRVAADLATREAGPPVWSYANAGWCLLGRAIETVTGLTWEEAIRTHRIAPRDLAQTTFATWAEDVPRATGHDVDAGGPTPVAAWVPRNLGPAVSTIQSTVTDVLRLARVHLDDPNLTMLRDAQSEVAIHGWFDAWCLGWGRFDWYGARVWGWDGVVNGQRSILRIVPERRGAVALLTNSATGRAMYRSLFPDLMRDWLGVSMAGLRRPDRGVPDRPAHVPHRPRRPRHTDGDVRSVRCERSSRRSVRDVVGLPRVPVRS